MALDIPIRFVEGLPHPVEVGFAVCGTRGSVGPRLASSRYRREPEHGTGRDGRHYRASEPSSHQMQDIERLQGELVKQTLDLRVHRRCAVVAAGLPGWPSAKTVVLNGYPGGPFT